MLGITLKLIAGGIQLKKKVFFFSLEINLLQTEGKYVDKKQKPLRDCQAEEIAVLWEAKASVCRKTSASPNTKWLYETETLENSPTYKGRLIECINHRLWITIKIEKRRGAQ